MEAHMTDKAADVDNPGEGFADQESDLGPAAGKTRRDSTRGSPGDTR